MAVKAQQVAARALLAARLDVLDAALQPHVHRGGEHVCLVPLDDEVAVGGAHVRQRLHLRRVRQEHDEEAGRHLERRVLVEQDGGGGDGKLADDDEQDPEVGVVGLELVVGAVEAAAELQRARVRQLVVAHADGAQQLVLHDELAVAVEPDAKTDGVARGVQQEAGDRPRQ